MAGILSSQDQTLYKLLEADFNSESVNKDVFISSASDTVTLGKVLMSGTLAGLPKRF